MSLAAILGARESGTISVGAEATVREVVTLLAEHRIGAVPIVEDDRVIGIMSERDVIYALKRDGAGMLDWPVERVMTRPPITVESSLSPLQGLSLMTRRRIRHLPVVDDGKLIGFISIGDLVKARIEHIEQEAEAMRAYIAS